jgi:porphobilinogen synthase
VSFPARRMRRLRKTPALRTLTAQTRLHPSDFVYPLFVSERIDRPEPISSMPGIQRYPVKDAAREADRTFKLGIPAVLLFGIPKAKDAAGSASLKSDGIVQRAIREIKSLNPEVAVFTDVCLCEYTDHGHCGIVRNGTIDNDATIEILAQQAVSHAGAGADVVSPSDMMDGRVQAIRRALDADDFHEVAIMSFAAKYCSAFYGPFREAVNSAPRFGDRRTYQMDPSNADEALAEIALDIEEGADVVMVKPALAYLDVIRRAKERFDVPVAAYNVSGEYSMVKLAASAQVADEKQLTLEILTAIKRAGADMIISYHAQDVCNWLR